MKQELIFDDKSDLETSFQHKVFINLLLVRDLFALFVGAEVNTILARFCICTLSEYSIVPQFKHPILD